MKKWLVIFWIGFVLAIGGNLYLFWHWPTMPDLGLSMFIYHYVIGGGWFMCGLAVFRILIKQKENK